jgi:hypothetical protein
VLKGENATAKPLILGSWRTEISPIPCAVPTERVDGARCLPTIQGMFLRHKRCEKGGKEANPTR